MRNSILKAFVLVFAMIVVVTFAYFTRRTHPVAIAQVQVTRIGNNQNGPFQEDYMATHRMLLRSLILAEKVASCEPIRQQLEGSGFRSFPDAKDSASLVTEILGGLTVVSSEDSKPNNVLTLKFRASDPEESKLILQSIINCYQNFVDDKWLHPQDANKKTGYEVTVTSPVTIRR